jgi:UDP-GlcNAc:undecaprenyl-phosphate/decaprenyl-phosphate GlcNAc-1-phosphate transferase
MNWQLFGILGLSLLCSAILVPIVRFVCIKTGFVKSPQNDRWHFRPTASLGGIAIFFSFVLSLVITAIIQHWRGGSTPEDFIQWQFLIGPGCIFLLGLVDDFRPLSPPVKLIGQIIAAAIVVFQGYTTNFFTPRIENSLIAQVPNIILTFVWIIGITNAINLLDNMDGLAAGVCFITAMLLSYFFYRADNLALTQVSLALAGSTLGFLFYNFPPASIFMGDSGALMLGFTLATLAIVRQPQASNVFAVMGVPTLLFLIPILDTLFVVFTRVLRGKSPFEGGKDHTSHRLIKFGFSERKTLLIIFIAALLSGFIGATLESIRYWYSLVIVPVLIVIFVLLISYLGGVKIVESQSPERSNNKISDIVANLTYRRRILEIILDFFIIGLAYYLAIFIRFNLIMNDSRLGYYVTTLPITLAAEYLSFFIFRIYRGIWRYTGIEDFIRYFQASIGGVILAAVVIVFLYPTNVFTPLLFILFGIFLFLGLSISRSSFQIMRLISRRQVKMGKSPILIAGAGDSGEFALKWLQSLPEGSYQPTGFIDEDPLLKGRRINGIPVLGDFDQLGEIIREKKIKGILVSPNPTFNIDLMQLFVQMGKENDCWVKELKIEVTEIDLGEHKEST